MAKIEGTQSIPAEWLDVYRGALLDGHPGDIIRKRYPYRLPKMQEGHYGVHPNQIKQRTRFKQALAIFAGLSPTERQRWYANRPIWESFLWYYNYCIMSALAGNADIEEGGAGVIKGIQILKDQVPATGTKTFTITTVDPTKTVVMIHGSGRKVPKVLRGSGSVATGGSTLAIGDTIDPAKSTVKLNGSDWKEEGPGESPFSVSIFPYVSNLTTTQISIAWSLTPNEAANVGWEITENIQGVVYPVLVSIGATSVVIDWSEVPDAAAYVSIIVIEYI